MAVQEDVMRIKKSLEKLMLNKSVVNLIFFSHIFTVSSTVLMLMYVNGVTSAIRIFMVKPSRKLLLFSISSTESVFLNETKTTENTKIIGKMRNAESKMRNAKCGMHVIG